MKAKNMAKWWKAHNYQKYCVEMCVKFKFMALLLDPSLGKTSIILDVFLKLKKKKKVKGVLVVVPLRPMFMSWPDEIKKWLNFRNISFTILHEKAGIKDFNFEKDKDFYFINPDKLEWLVEKLKKKNIKDWPFNMLVVDESTKFKEMSTKRHIQLSKIVPLFNYRYILTGTPSPNGLQNLQGQLFIVDKGETFGTKKGYFLHEYFKQIGNPKWKQYQIREDKRELLYKKFAKFAIRLRAEDYLDLPEIKFNTIKVILPPKARKVYNKMEQEFFTEIDGSAFTALSSGSAYQKCCQLANGALYINENEEEQHLKTKNRRPEKFAVVHNAKLEALDALIEELDGKPLFIAYRFRHDLKRLKKHFGKRLECLGKSSDILSFPKIQKRWNAGKISLLAAYPATAALGLNLQGAGNDVCYFSLIHSLEDYEQFYKRVYRQGMSSGGMRVHHLIAANTVDELIFKRLKEKDLDQKRFLKYVQEYRKKRLHGLEIEV